MGAVSPATGGGSIPLSLSERLNAGITFAVGNTRAFAAVGQQGQERCHQSSSPQEMGPDLPPKLDSVGRRVCAQDLLQRGATLLAVGIPCMWLST